VAPHTEKYGGLLPSLFHNTDEAPKPAVGWRPGTVIVESPVPVAQVAPAKPVAPVAVKEPSHSVAQVAPAKPVAPVAVKEPSHPVAPVPPANHVAPVTMKEPSHPAAPRPAASDADWLSVPKLLGVLKDSHTSVQREWAADCLGGADCLSNPMVVPALMTAARTDASPNVRIACIHTLVKLRAPGSDVLATFHALTADKDPNVQREASQALTRIGVSKPAARIQQVGGNTPTP
jgi:hypothetical protein